MDQQGANSETDASGDNPPWPTPGHRCSIDCYPVHPIYPIRPGTFGPPPPDNNLSWRHIPVMLLALILMLGFLLLMLNPINPFTGEH
jgi:hypothetical protein